jgi:hypothetical protein
VVGGGGQGRGLSGEGAARQGEGGAEVGRGGVERGGEGAGRASYRWVERPAGAGAVFQDCCCCCGSCKNFSGVAGLRRRGGRLAAAHLVSLYIPTHTHTHTHTQTHTCERTQEAHTHAHTRTHTHTHRMGSPQNPIQKPLKPSAPPKSNRKRPRVNVPPPPPPHLPLSQRRHLAPGVVVPCERRRAARPARCINQLHREPAPLRPLARRVAREAGFGACGID